MICSHVFSSFGSAFTVISVDVEVRLIISCFILQMKISSPSLALSWAALVQALQMRVASLSSLSPRVLITSGCCVSSNTAFFQSILGWKAANQGYPKTSSSSPMCVTLPLNVSLNLGLGTAHDTTWHELMYMTPQ